MGFGSKCSILNGQVIYIKNLKLNFADMWLIPLDHVTYAIFQKKGAVLSQITLFLHTQTYWGGYIWGKIPQYPCLGLYIQNVLGAYFKTVVYTCVYTPTCPGIQSEDTIYIRV